MVADRQIYQFLHEPIQPSLDQILLLLKPKINKKVPFQTLFFFRRFWWCGKMSHNVLKTALELCEHIRDFYKIVFPGFFTTHTKKCIPNKSQQNAPKKWSQFVCSANSAKCCIVFPSSFIVKKRRLAAITCSSSCKKEIKTDVKNLFAFRIFLTGHNSFQNTETKCCTQKEIMKFLRE